jgi:hypothetical protein
VKFAELAKNPEKSRVGIEWEDKTRKSADKSLNDINFECDVDKFT